VLGSVLDLEFKSYTLCKNIDIMLSLLDNSPTNQLAVSQVAGWSTCWQTNFLWQRL